MLGVAIYLGIGVVVAGLLLRIRHVRMTAPIPDGWTLQQRKRAESFQKNDGYGKGSMYMVNVARGCLSDGLLAARAIRGRAPARPVWDHRARSPS